MALEAEPTYAPLDLPDLGDPSTKQLQHPQISPEGFDHPFESCNPWDPLFPGFDPLAPTLPRAQQQLNFEYECIDQSNRAHPLLDVSAPPPLSFQSLSLASPSPLPSLYAPARRSRTRTRRRKTISNPELIAPIVAASHLLWLRERECLLKSPNSLKTFQSRHLDTRIALARFRLPTGVLLYAKLDIVWVSGLFQCRLKIDVVAQLRHLHAESVEVFAVPNNFWQDQLITDTLTPLASFSEHWTTACTPNLLLLTAALQQRKRERVPRTKRPAAKSAGPSVSNVNSFVFTTR